MNNNIIKLVITLLITAGLIACASSPEEGSGEAQAQATEASTASTSTDAPAASGDAPAETTASAAPAPAAPPAPAVEPEEVKPPKIVESCKDEPYGKYEKQARESIAKGLENTKAEKFGVGFRNVAEHNKWSKVHNALFKSVNDACGALSDCAKKHKKDKDTECVAQAKTFATWQSLAKDFASKAKSVETTEPPIICSLEPNLADPAKCFHGRAESIAKVCDSDECKETGDCWRSVGFLDAAIIQAEQSCGFVHQKLKDCRGYTEATKRRKDKFAQCKEMQDTLNISIFPVL